MMGETMLQSARNGLHLVELMSAKGAPWEPPNIYYLLPRLVALHKLMLKTFTYLTGHREVKLVLKQRLRLTS